MNRPYNRLLQHTSKSKFDVGRIISSPTNHQATTTYFRPKKNGPHKETSHAERSLPSANTGRVILPRMNAPMFAPSTSTHKNFSQRKVFCGAFFQKSDPSAPAGAPRAAAPPRSRHVKLTYYTTYERKCQIRIENMLKLRLKWGYNVKKTEVTLCN